jgi:hypothetical protein
MSEKLFLFIAIERYVEPLMIYIESTTLIYCIGAVAFTITPLLAIKL